MRAIDVVLIEIVLLMLMFIWPSSDKVSSVDKCSKKNCHSPPPPPLIELFFPKHFFCLFFLLQSSLSYETVFHLVKIKNDKSSSILGGLSKFSIKGGGHTPQFG